MVCYANGEEELYDSSADPLEYVNLAGRTEYAARKAELAAHLPQRNAANLPGGERKGAAAKQGKGEGKGQGKAKRAAAKLRASGSSGGAPPGASKP